MDMKRALLWYLGILAVMAVGVYLGLELFVNRAGTAGPGEQEALSVEPDAGPAVQPATPVPGASAEESAAVDASPLGRETDTETSAGTASRVSDLRKPAI